MKKISNCFLQCKAIVSTIALLNFKQSFMKPYLSKTEAIDDLHKRGFREDFELFGTDLLWIQKKVFLRHWQFIIAEAHRFLSLSGKELVLFAVMAKGNSIRGILINHYKSYTDKTPPVINRKLIEMDSNYLNQQYDYVDETFSR